MGGERRQAAARPVTLSVMVDKPGAPARTDGVGMIGAVECRHCSRDFHGRRGTELDLMEMVRPMGDHWDGEVGNGDLYVAA